MATKSQEKKVATHLHELLTLFLPEVWASPWEQYLVRVDPRAMCEEHTLTLLKQLEEITTDCRTTHGLPPSSWLLESRDEGAPPETGTEKLPTTPPDTDPLDTDAGLTILLIEVWLIGLASEKADSFDTLPASSFGTVCDDMWPLGSTGMMEQFFSLPSFPPWEDVQDLFRRVKARLPAGESLPKSATDLLLAIML